MVNVSPKSEASSSATSGSPSFSDNKPDIVTSSHRANSIYPSAQPPKTNPEFGRSIQKVKMNSLTANPLLDEIANSAPKRKKT